MNDPLATISQNKLICTGTQLEFAKTPDLSPAVTSAAEFAQLVSDYYVFFREEISKDVGFLRAVQGHRSIQAFSDAVYQLRTAHQHSDNPEASKFETSWQDEHRSWADQGVALAELLTEALTQLAHNSGRVRRDAALTKTWKETSAADPGAIFVSVCADLGVSFGDGNARRLIRLVEGRVKAQLRATDNPQARIEAWCAEEITGQSRNLPVAYHAVLDRLGLLGDRRASAALHLAYSLAASTSLRGDTFLDRIEEVWKVASR